MPQLWQLRDLGDVSEIGHIRAAKIEITKSSLPSHGGLYPIRKSVRACVNRERERERDATPSEPWQPNLRRLHRVRSL